MINDYATALLGLALSISLLLMIWFRGSRLGTMTKGWRHFMAACLLIFWVGFLVARLGQHPIQQVSWLVVVIIAGTCGITGSLLLFFCKGERDARFLDSLGKRGRYIYWFFLVLGFGLIWWAAAGHALQRIWLGEVCGFLLLLGTFCSGLWYAKKHQPS